jgi:sporulation protein YlmC with PRC-barrel domain
MRSASIRGDEMQFNAAWREAFMSIDYYKWVLAGVIAALASAPDWIAAQEGQPPQPQSQPSEQHLREAPGSSGGRLRLLPEYAMPGKNAAGTAAQGHQSPISLLTPENLKNMEVMGPSGETIGKVEDVVRSRKDGFIYAIISSGGVWGIGAKETPVSLKELEVYGSKLRIGTTKSELPRWPDYRRDQYVGLEPEDKPVADFAAFEVFPSNGQEKTPQ